MAAEIVHMVGDVEDAKLAEGEHRIVRTRCGRAIDHPVVTANVGPTRYDLVGSNGNKFYCTTRAQCATCVKCRNLLTAGTIYVPKVRPAVAKKRAVAHASAAAPRAARTHARP